MGLLNTLSVSCFKGIAGTQEIAFNDLTILTTGNRSGKTSCLEALSLLKELGGRGLQPWHREYLSKFLGTIGITTRGGTSYEVKLSKDDSFKKDGTFAETVASKKNVTIIERKFGGKTVTMRNEKTRSNGEFELTHPNVSAIRQFLKWKLWSPEVEELVKVLGGLQHYNMRSINLFQVKQPSPVTVCHGNTTPFDRWGNLWCCLKELQLVREQDSRYNTILFYMGKVFGDDFLDLEFENVQRNGEPAVAASVVRQSSREPLPSHLMTDQQVAFLGVLTCLFGPPVDSGTILSLDELDLSLSTATQYWLAAAVNLALTDFNRQIVCTALNALMLNELCFACPEAKRTIIPIGGVPAETIDGHSITIKDVLATAEEILQSAG